MFYRNLRVFLCLFLLLITNDSSILSIYCTLFFLPSFSSSGISCYFIQYFILIGCNTYTIFFFLVLPQCLEGIRVGAIENRFEELVLILLQITTKFEEFSRTFYRLHFSYLYFLMHLSNLPLVFFFSLSFSNFIEDELYYF